MASKRTYGVPPATGARIVAAFVDSDGNAVLPGLNTDGTLPVSQSAAPLPTGAATAIRQDTGNNSLSSIDGKIPAKGQAAMAASVPVVLASDQPAVPVSATGLSRIPALGQTTMANSTPVVLASDQSPATVVGQFKRVAGTSFTRPATTGTAVPGTVIGPVTTPAVITFAGCARANGGSGILRAAFTNIKWPSGTPVATGFSHRLKIFNVAPTPVADGTNWPVNQANFTGWQGSFDFSGMNGEGATQTGDSIHGMGAPVVGAGDSDIPFVCAANDTNLYGVLVNEGTNTWVASLQYDTALLVDQN